jgi:hypothetical protein
MEASDKVRVDYSYTESDSTGPKLAHEATGLEACLRRDHGIETSHKE